MDERTRKEIIRLKGNVINNKFIDLFDREWTEITKRLNASGFDLSKIAIVEMAKSRK